MSDWRTPFELCAPTLPGGAKAQIWRQAALVNFETAGIPRPKAEAWKHTPLKAITKPEFTVSPASSVTELPDVEDVLRLVLVDGVLDAQRSDSLPSGVTVASVRDLLDSGDELITSALPDTVNAPFDQLNRAFVAGGVVIDIARGATIDTPIAIVMLGGDSGSAVHLQNHIRLGDNSKATVLELFKVRAGLHNVLTSTTIGKNAELHHIVLQDNGPEALLLADHRHTLAADARLLGTSVAAGSAWARVGVHALLVGNGATCDLSGVYLGRDSQHHDHTLVVEHVGSHGTSMQRFRGILTDKSRGVFNSLLVVTETGVYADGLQDNRNVLLTDTAHADSEPALRIHTDEVKAAHGSAIGALDEDALFYMQTRGINRSDARRLLTAGIAREVLKNIHSEPLEQLATSLVDTWLAQAVS